MRDVRSPADDSQNQADGATELRARHPNMFQMKMLPSSPTDVSCLSSGLKLIKRHDGAGEGGGRIEQLVGRKNKVIFGFIHFGAIDASQ